MKLYKSVTVVFKDRDDDAHPLKWFRDRIDLNQLEISGEIVNGKAEQ